VKDACLEFLSQSILETMEVDIPPPLQKKIKGLLKGKSRSSRRLSQISLISKRQSVAGELEAGPEDDASKQNVAIAGSRRSSRASNEEPNSIA